MAVQRPDYKDLDYALQELVLASEGKPLQRTQPFYVGDKVTCTLVGQAVGTVAFYGVTPFSNGAECVGIVFDAALGKNNGTVNDFHGFTCAPNHGLYVPKSSVQLAPATRPVTNLRPSGTPLVSPTSVTSPLIGITPALAASGISPTLAVPGSIARQQTASPVLYSSPQWAFDAAPLPFPSVQQPQQQPQAQQYFPPPPQQQQQQQPQFIMPQLQSRLPAVPIPPPPTVPSSGKTNGEFVVYVLWDLENMIPEDGAGAWIVSAMEDKITEVLHEARISLYSKILFRITGFIRLKSRDRSRNDGISVSQRVLKEIRSKNVNISLAPADKEGSADNELRSKISEIKDDSRRIQEACALVVVSSDGDFASDMNDLRRNHRSYFNPVIAIIGDINPMASRPNRPIANPALLSAADKVIHWADIEALAAKNVPAPQAVPATQRIERHYPIRKGIFVEHPQLKGDLIREARIYHSFVDMAKYESHVVVSAPSEEIMNEFMPRVIRLIENGGSAPQQRTCYYFNNGGCKKDNCDYAHIADSNVKAPPPRQPLAQPVQAPATATTATTTNYHSLRAEVTHTLYRATSPSISTVYTQSSSTTTFPSSGDQALAQPRRVCYYYNQGKCVKDNCDYLHELDPNVPPPRRAGLPRRLD